MNTERDKFLTESMGECWHKLVEDLDDYTDFTCIKCGKQVFDILEANIDFSTPNGFFKLWKWGQKQTWWNSFVANVLLKQSGCHMIKTYIDPNQFADAVYDFLKEQK